MKKNASSIIISLLMVMLLSSCSVWKTYPIELPESDDVVSISVMSGDKTASSTDEVRIEEIMSILTDVKATSKASTNDFPSVSDYITIYLNCFDNTSKRLFFYEENGQEYVEQAYMGIYKPASSLGIHIRNLLEPLEN